MPHTLYTLQPILRRTCGISLITLLHAGVFLALLNGLGIRNLQLPAPPLITRVLELPAPKTQENLREPIPEPYSVTNDSQTIEKPLIPTISVSEESDDVWTTRVAEQAVVTRSENKPVITMARVDPSHPLSQPDYPPASRRLGEHGSVELLLYVLPNGRVEEARITRSSGFSRLDEAAIREAKRKWKLLPGSENGTPTAGWTSVVITFKLVQ